MLTTIALSVLLGPTYTKANENEPDTDGDCDISGDRINNKMVNLSSSTKKISSETGFLTLNQS